MLLLFLGLFACFEPPPPPEPTVDSGLTRAAVDALCKVVEGAKGTCERDGDTARFGGHALKLTAWVESQTQTMASLVLAGRVEVVVDGTAQPVLRTPVRAFGTNYEEAIGRGVHEWALVYGIGIADWALADPTRPALRAVAKDAARPAAAFRDGTLYRGWTLVRKTTQKIEHGLILAALEPTTSHWTGGPHAVVVEVEGTSDGPNPTVWVDGVPDAEAAAAVKATGLGGSLGAQVRQFYLWAP